MESIQYGSKDELVGQVELLKKMLKSPDGEQRAVAYWALGQTGDFGLVQQIIPGLRDPNLTVNSNALQALRYISRKPSGFGLPFDPLDGLQPGASEEQKVAHANQWRTRAYNAWSKWYFQVRPYDERDGLDQLEALIQ